MDVLEKPTGREPEGAWERRLLASVTMVAKIRVITHPRARLANSAPRVASVAGAARGHDASPAGRRAIGIGASTGGPGAVLEVLRALPPAFPVPILVVIHIDEAFGAALADWLEAQTAKRVLLGWDGMPLPEVGDGQVILAPPGRHLEVRRGRIRLTDAPERHSCRPAVDVLFDSLAADLGAEAVGCLLTGMGRDGAAGLLALRDRGAATIAQDEATSVVFGMPGEAVKIGAAQHVLPLGQIARALVDLAAPASFRGSPS